MRAPDSAPSGPAAVVAVGAALLAFAFAGFAAEALLIALAIPVLIAILRRPQVGVLLIAALAPFHGLLQITSLPSEVSAWKEVLVGTVLVATFVCPRSARAPRDRHRPGWLPALLLFVLVGLGSAAAAHNVEAAVGLKVDFFYVLLALAIWRCPLAERERDRLVSILMGTGFVCALVGLWQQVVGDVALHNLGYEYNTTIRKAGSILRSFSTFDTPFPFAYFLVLVLLIGIPVALSEPTRLRNRLFLLAVPVYVLGLLSTVVRAGVLGLGVGLAYLGFRRYRLLLAGLPLALVAVVVLGVLGGATTSSFSSGTSFLQRNQGWEENFVQVSRHPLGVGIGTTGAAANKASELTPVASVYNPDNYYFKTVYELGVLGLWMFVLFLFGAFASTQGAASLAKPRDGPLLDGIAASILAAAAASAVANYFDAFPVDVYFWVLLALAATMDASRRMAERARPEEAPVDT